jgi:hypothetical protein
VTHIRRFSVPSDASVFILEDNADRIAWFKAHIPHAVIATTSSKAIDILRENDFRIIFLDHDLGFLDAAYPNRLHGNGKEVARFLAWTQSRAVMVIHSRNEIGARAIKKYLPHAHIAPFGEFEIENLLKQDGGLEADDSNSPFGLHCTRTRQ